jgi:hypothetical protein
MEHIINEVLGYNGRMISGSKSGYKKLFPVNAAVFNANLCTTEGKFWYGDIDLTVDKDKLVILAKEFDKDIYVLYETDARFENEDKPLLQHAIVIFKKSGLIELKSEYMVFDKDGNITFKK